ncbi:3'-5' exonuclease [Halopseudomonas pachastrellae]|uniref:3'-5' exonuclease n=1 Tax=Halopseudomonas pachastrellae TaxID=254161 RepID=UPI003D7E3A5E
MNPLSWIAARRQKLDPEQQARLTALSAPLALDETPLSRARMVVVDLETSGLNVNRDRILSVGAVVVENGSIDLGSQYECTLFQANHRVTESVLIHGIAPSEVAQGVAPVDALLDFMAFADNGVFVAFHAAFDQRMLQRGLRQTLNTRLRHVFLDVAELAPMLCPEATGRKTLDDWQDYFQLRNSQRHHASADALATAEILLILLSRARAQGIQTLAELNARLRHWRRLRQARIGSL